MKKESIKGLVCIGAPKCGTTLLYKQIVKDNQFNNPLEKELDFWNCKKNVLDSNSPYMRKLPRTLQKIFKDFNQNDFFNFYKTSDFSKAFLDFSPDYMRLEKGTMLEMQEFYDDLKIILCIRNPLDRVESHFNYALRLRRNLFLRCLKWCYYQFSKTKLATSYSEVFDNWCDVIGEENIIIICYEDLVSSSEVVSQQLSKFIGVPIDINVNNYVNKTEYKSIFSENLRKRVTNFYQDQFIFWRRNRCK